MRTLVLLDAARADLVEIAGYIGKRERDGSRGAAFARRLADK